MRLASLHKERSRLPTRAWALRGLLSGYSGVPEQRFILGRAGSDDVLRNGIDTSLEGTKVTILTTHAKLSRSPAQMRFLANTRALPWSRPAGPKQSRRTGNVVSSFCRPDQKASKDPASGATTGADGDGFAEGRTARQNRGLCVGQKTGAEVQQTEVAILTKLMIEAALAEKSR
jgi:hypothetical protein